MSDGTRTVYFELHIRPMFRLIDRDHMLRMGTPKFDLFKYEDVRMMTEGTSTVKPQMLAWIEGKRMPPNSKGGPWPEEWMALFRRWATDKVNPYARLPLADVKVGGWKAAREDDVVTLAAKGTKPNSADFVWIERLTAAESPREYIIYREPAGPPGAPVDFATSETFFSGDPGNVIIVHDASGAPKEIKIEE
jgi:hypothetical protein